MMKSMNFTEANTIVEDMRMYKSRDDKTGAKRLLLYINERNESVSLSIMTDGRIPFGGGFDRESFVSAELHLKA